MAFSGVAGGYDAGCCGVGGDGGLDKHAHTRDVDLFGAGEDGLYKFGEEEAVGPVDGLAVELGEDSGGEGFEEVAVFAEKQ